MSWFKKHQREDPLTNDQVKIVMTFMKCNDAEARQMLVKHQIILLTEHAIQSIKKTISVLQKKGTDPTVLQAMQKAEDRLALLEDARRVGAQEAIRRNEQKNHDIQSICIQFLGVPIADLATFTQQHRDVLFNPRVIHSIEYLLNDGREELQDDIEQWRGRLQFLKDAQVYGFDHAWNQYMVFVARKFQEKFGGAFRDFPRGEH